MIVVEVAYALPDKQDIIKLNIANDLTISEIIKLSGLLAKYPEINIDALAVGIYGKRIYEIDSYVVQDKDRIEIYRPLLKSPNQKRLERAKIK